jgi:hypothetical protein
MRVMRAAAFAALSVVGSLAVYRLAADRPLFTQDASTGATQSEAAQVPTRSYRHADFADEAASVEARSIADWIVDSRDNLGMRFVIVDKVDARVFVFDAAGRLTGASAALVGSARGDDSAPGIGDKKLSDITPAERTTPAGRFLAEPGLNINGEHIVWVDYDAAVSIHAVRPSNRKERRLHRLASPTPADNRISYGCINVPLNFYRNVVAPAFNGTRGVVYVLPETRPAQVVFGSYEVPASASGARSTMARAGHP